MEGRDSLPISWINTSLRTIAADSAEDSDALISTSYGRNSDRSARSLIVEGRDCVKVEVLQYCAFGSF